MTDHNPCHTRRRFLRAACVTPAIPALAALATREAAAAEKVDPAAPNAKALKYVHDSTVDGQWCNNCQLYQAGADAEWAGCAIFQNNLVKGTGWCSAWVKKTA